MIDIRSAILFSAIMAFAAAKLCSQNAGDSPTAEKIGVSAAYGFTYNSLLKPTADGKEQFSSNDTRGRAFGLGIKYFGRDLTDDGVFFDVSLMAIFFDCDYNAPGKSYPILLRDDLGLPYTVNVNTAYELKTNYMTAEAEIFGGYNPIGNFNFFTGIGLALLFEDFEEQVYSVTKPDGISLKREENWKELGYIYSDDNRSVIFYDGTIRDVNRYNFLISGGISYDLQIYNAVFSPSLICKYYLFDIISRESWSLAALSFGVTMRYFSGR